MRRVEDRLIAERQQLLQRIVKEACNLALAVGVKVGAPDIAHEQRIAREHPHRTVGIFTVMDDKGEVIVGVSRCLQHLDGELSDLKFVALARCLREGNFARCIGTVQHLCPCHLGENGGACDEVLIAMRFEDMGDLQPLGARFFKVDFAIAPRINHRRFSAGPDEIGQVREAGRFDLFEKHGGSPSFKLSLSSNAVGHRRVPFEQSASVQGCACSCTRKAPRSSPGSKPVARSSG